MGRTSSRTCWRVADLLSYDGAPATAAQLGGWTPIAAQQTATGYEVALKAGSQYWVWNTDTSGNYASAPVGPVSGTNQALETIETSFNYDLNGDGSIGIPPPKVIEFVRLDEPGDGLDELLSRAQRRDGG